MPLWLDELLCMQPLRLTLRTSPVSLRRRGPIAWAHISDLPDPTPWLEGGELLLTTGLGISRSERVQREFVRKVADRGCVALGFSASEDGSVLGGVLSEAEAQGLPLFAIPHEVPLIAITKAVSQALYEERYRSLHSATKMHRRVLRAVLQGEGLPGVMRASRRSTPGFCYLLYDFSGQLLAGTVPGNLEAESLFRRAATALGRGERASIEVAGSYAEVGAVRLLGQVEAVLVAIASRPVVDDQLLLVEQAMMGVSLELARRVSYREERRNRVGELLDDVQAGLVAPSSILLRLERMGLSPQGGYGVLCLREPAGVPGQRFLTAVEDAAARASGLVGISGGRLYCLVVSDKLGVAEDLVELADSSGWTGLRVGRSSVHYDVEGFRAAMGEAELAATAESPAAIRDLADLGVSGLIAGIRRDAVTDVFVDEVLGPLILHDAEENGQLVETLRTYLASGCRPGEATAKLFVHRHTLAYRLEQIRKLTGRDVRDGEQMLTFGLALKIRDQEANSRWTRPRHRSKGA
jgi:purine catabolism regulator